MLNISSFISKMTERYQHHVKDLPDYIQSIYQHRGVVSIKFSNSHCGDCQKEKFQEYSNKMNMERSIEEVPLERENIKCPLHKEYLQLHISSFSMEYRIKHSTAKIETLEVPQPPTVPSYIWEEWAKFWNCHKEIYISLFWIHRLENYCRRDSVCWKSKVFKDLPELEKEIRYCDDIDLRYEIDFTDDSYFSEVVFNKKADTLWKELCFKRFWIQFRLYLRNRDFHVVEDLCNFFETKGIRGNIESYDFERNFYLHIPKEVLTYTYVPLYIDIPEEEEDADITINVFGAAGVSNRSREESHLTVEAVRGVERLEIFGPPENPDDLLVNPDVENPEQNLVVEGSPDVVNPDVENPDSNLSDKSSPDEQVVNPDIENPDSVLCGESSSAVVGSLDVEVPDSNLSGRLSPNEQIVSPDIENPDQNLSGESPPDEVVVVTPDIENPDPDLYGESSPVEEVVVNPDVENPDPDLSGESSPVEEVIVNPDIENPDPDLSGESSPDEEIVVAPDVEDPDPDVSGESSDEGIVVAPGVENPDPDLSGESSDEGIVVAPGVENPDPDLSGESSPDEGIVVVPGVENPDPDLSGESSPDEEVVVNPDVENPDPDVSGESSPDEEVVVNPDVENPDPDLPDESSRDVQAHGSPSPRNEEDQREEKDKISDESEDLSISPPQPFEDIEAEEEDSSSDDIIIEDDDADDRENLNAPPPQPIQDIQVEGVDSPAQDGNAVENNDLIIPPSELFQDVPPPQPLEEVASNVIQEQVLTEEERKDDEIQVNPPVPAPINEDEGNDGLQLGWVNSTVNYVRHFAGGVLSMFSRFKRMIIRERDEIQVNPPVPINEVEGNGGLQLQRVDSTVNYGRHLAGGVLARFSNFRNAVFLRSDSYLSWLNPIFRPRSSFGFRFYGYYSDYWWFSYNLQVKYRAENIMQRMEKECVEFLKSSCNPELDHVLFYPPLMPCENEHITECWQLRTATYRLDDKFMRICILGKQEIEKEDLEARNISIVYLNRRDQHEEWNELQYGDVVPMELEVFEKKIMRSFRRRPKNFIGEILNFCETIYHDKSKFDLRNVPCNFDHDYIQFWLRRYTLSSLFSKGIEIKNECWYTTPPEIISKTIAKRIGLRRYRLVIDANCGSGLNAIQLALSHELVVAIDKNPSNIQSARNNAQIYGVEDKIIYKVGDFSTMDLSEFEAGAIFLNPENMDPRRILKEYDVLSLGGKSDCKKLLDDARKITPNIVLYLPPHSNIFQVIEVCKPFEKAEIQFNNVCNDKESICVYFGDFVH
ncbi:Trimethylguanosine synthase [Armadillidium vulgare]|nr:Trimethylguanosine synthase [Armadillidium vulgare]